MRPGGADGVTLIADQCLPGIGFAVLRCVGDSVCATGQEAWMPFFIGLEAAACEMAGQIEESLILSEEAFQIVERTGATQRLDLHQIHPLRVARPGPC
jgi:hypothetical protein